MIPRYRGALRLTRQMGFDVFALPTTYDVTGMAFCSKIDQKRYINVFGSVHSRLWLFVLLHEIAHHVLRHTDRWTSTPTWMKEYQADQMALKLLADLQPAAHAFAEQNSKEHIRPIMQDLIDYEIWHHVDEEIATWAGCSFPDGWGAYKARTQPGVDEEDIPF